MESEVSDFGAACFWPRVPAVTIATKPVSLGQALAAVKLPPAEIGDFGLHQACSQYSPRLKCARRERTRRLPQGFGPDEHMIETTLSGFEGIDDQAIVAIGEDVLSPVRDLSIPHGAIP